MLLCAGAQSRVERRFKLGDAQQEDALEIVDGGRIGCSNSLKTFKSAAKVLDFVDRGLGDGYRWFGIHGNEQIVPLSTSQGSDTHHRSLTCGAVELRASGP